MKKIDNNLVVIALSIMCIVLLLLCLWGLVFQPKPVTNTTVDTRVKVISDNRFIDIHKISVDKHDYIVSRLGLSAVSMVHSESCACKE